MLLKIAQLNANFNSFKVALMLSKGAKYNAMSMIVAFIYLISLDSSWMKHANTPAMYTGRVDLVNSVLSSTTEDTEGDWYKHYLIWKKQYLPACSEGTDNASVNRRLICTERINSWVCSMSSFELHMQHLSLSVIQKWVGLYMLLTVSCVKVWPK